jgi:hypothetical protein
MSRAADSARATVELAIGEAEHAVAETTDAHEAWEIAAAIGDALNKARQRAARLRAVAALRIKDQDSLSLRGLADKIGVAPSRAERLVNAAKEASRE